VIDSETGLDVLPCPFCASESEIVIRGVQRRSIECTHCIVHFSEFYADRRLETIDAWNRLPR